MGVLISPIAGHHIVPFGTQLGQDALGIDQVFGATQGDESYFGGLFCVGHRSITLRWLLFKGADFTGMANQKLYNRGCQAEQYLRSGPSAIGRQGEPCMMVAVVTVRGLQFPQTG